MLAVGKLSKGIVHEKFDMCLRAPTIGIGKNNVCERDVFYRCEFREAPFTIQLICVEKLASVLCVPCPPRVRIFPCDVLFGHDDDERRLFVCYKNSHNFDPRKISDP